MLKLMFALILCLATLACDADDLGFGGVPLLGPADNLRHLQRPYDLVKLNVLGLNYCENLLDMRLNITSYTHLGFNSSTADAWNLQFPDDSARFLEGVAWEDEFSPVVRLELARRLVKGLLAARVPGTASDSYFRHRSDGKTFLLFGDPAGAGGRMVVSMWGDELTGSVKTGFRVDRGDGWKDERDFRVSDPPGAVTTPGEARSPAHWNESPVTVRRRYEAPGAAVECTGRYWLSDEDRPIEVGYASPGARALQVVVGEPTRAIPMLGNARIPTVLHLPDGAAFRSDRDGDRAFDRPAFRCLLVRRPAAFASSGHSAALLVVWDGHPARVEADAEHGYGQVRITFNGSAGRVWVYPYYWLDDADLDAVFRSADHFVQWGTLLQNGFPSQQMLNAIPAGLAAGAYLLTRYRDPVAQTARVNAVRAVDRLFAAEDGGKRLARVFFTVKAAAWMVKAAREAHDDAMARRCAAYLDRAMRRMCSAASGYDGSAWADGWTHFNSAKACWLAYDATGRIEYRMAYQRALGVYTIDERGIYRYGRKMDAPGGFETYSGSLPLALWGHAGWLDSVDRLIALEAPNGWNDPTRPVRDTWNDAGAGPWAQDDANPEYVGFALRGAHIPVRGKHILPVGAFPWYDRTGAVRITRQPMVRNPYFLPGTEPVRVERPGSTRSPRAVTTVTLTPGSAAERRAAVALPGTVRAGRRTCTGSDPLVLRFPTGGASGLALDLRIRGDGYAVDVSPDGRRWFTRLDTWDRAMADQSLDLSFLAGSREELVRLCQFAPPQDARLLAAPGASKVERGRRIVPPGDSVVWRIDLPQARAAWLEILAGNGYRVDCSPDGRRWLHGIAAADAGAPGASAGKDGTVMRMLDVSPCLRTGRAAYLRLTDDGGSAFGGGTAYLQRITAYGTLQPAGVWVRIRCVATRPGSSFALDRIALRRW